MHYRISEIASMLGLSISALRFFEKNGLLSPKRDEQNDYRLYEPIDLNRFLRIKTYTECGFTLQETVNLLKTESLGEISSLYLGRADELERELAWKKRCLDYMRDMARELDYAQSMVGKWAFRARPAMYCLPFRTKEQITLSSEIRDRTRQWVSYKPLSQSLVITSPDTLRVSAQLGTFGMLIEERYAEGLNIEPDQLVTYYPREEQCVFCVYTGNTGTPGGMEEWLSSIERELRASGYEPYGEIIGRVLHTGHGSNDKLFGAVEYWLPVRTLG